MHTSPTTLSSLLAHLHAIGSALTQEEAVEEAIRAWIAAPENAPSAGVQWKSLFLPAGTRLRIWRHPDHPEARVVGNRILCEGMPVSPNQYVRDCPGAHRNAWELVSVLLPGEKHWTLADQLRRRERARLAVPQAASTRDATAAAEKVVRPQHRWGERRAWNTAGRRETDQMPEPVFLDH